MITHSSILARRIPGREEPTMDRGAWRVKSMGSLRVRHDWATSLSLFTFMHWRRKWQPTPVFLPGESRGWRSLVGCCLWGRTELDMTEATQQQQQQQQQRPQAYILLSRCFFVPSWIPLGVTYQSPVLSARLFNSFARPFSRPFSYSYFSVINM